jgi:hypothetical protein
MRHAQTTGGRGAGAPGRVLSLGRLLGRSLFPLVALALIASTPWSGAWGVLLLALVWWNVVTRVA